MEKWTTPVSLPDLSALRNYFHQPLNDDKKIPVSQETFDQMCTPYAQDAEQALSREQLSALFRVSEEESAPAFQLRFCIAIQHTPPRNSTEDAYHSAYDFNISHIISSILPEGQTGRNSNNHMGTGLNWPDYSFLMHNHCILRGEEKGFQMEGDPARELIDKFVGRWSYGHLPFVLGLLSFYYHLIKL